MSMFTPIPAKPPAVVEGLERGHSVIFELDAKGVLRMSRNGSDGIPEPICPECEKPIEWVLGIFSFSTLKDDGTYHLTHAHCAWLPERFRKEQAKAVAMGKLRRKKEKEDVHEN